MIDPEAPESNDHAGGHLNIPLPTLGGMQVWTDHRWWFGWRIQQNLLTGHWRLLNSANIRKAWGSREACESALEQEIQASPQADPEQVVILSHGLMRSNASMLGLGRSLEQAGMGPIVYFNYGSSRASMAEHAAAFRETVESLPGRPRLFFVGHSMGNIVARYAIGDWQRQNPPSEILGRMDRVVMLGPPNQGSAIAKRLGQTGLFGVVVGKAGLALGPQWQQIEEKLGTPPCPFGIVAGDTSNWAPGNPMLSGPSDMIVSVEESHLEGSTETLIVPDLHSFLMDDRHVQAAVARFLQGGKLAEQ